MRGGPPLLPAPLPLSYHPRVYQPRQAKQSPLYRIVEEHLETFLAEAAEDAGSRPPAYAEGSLRRLLECGIPRFGVVRFLCRSCGKDLFVPFSCKERGACPSCDAKATAPHCT